MIVEDNDYFYERKLSFHIIQTDGYVFLILKFARIAESFESIIWIHLERNLKKSLKSCFLKNIPLAFRAAATDNFHVRRTRLIDSNDMQQICAGTRPCFLHGYLYFKYADYLIFILMNYNISFVRKFCYVFILFAFIVNWDGEVSLRQWIRFVLRSFIWCNSAPIIIMTISKWS